MGHHPIGRCAAHGLEESVWSNGLGLTEGILAKLGFSG
jgi:hypothetical protein